ncbi:MAG TPA: hypothetical protein DCE65_02740 [Clostridiales bacterium]|nr:hypothetical protein [Clostridiales bacterium]
MCAFPPADSIIEQARAFVNKIKGVCGKNAKNGERRFFYFSGNNRRISVEFQKSAALRVEEHIAEELLWKTKIRMRR